MSVIKPHIQAMAAYTPPLDGRNPKTHTLLDFNERTLPVGEHIQQALIEYIQSGRLQMYPAYGDITARLARYASVNAAQVMITNGSDQGLELIFRSVCTAGDTVVIPAPTFAMYDQLAQVEKCHVISPYYQKGSGYPVQEVLDAITPDVKLVVISNPNNPCGTLAARDDVIRILQQACSGKNNAAVLLDECYFEYSHATVCDLIDEYPHLFITRTFSKTWGIPSLRFGYILSHQSNINALLSVRGPYDINQLAVVAARAALDNQHELQQYTREVMEQSKPLLEEYLAQQGVEFWSSEANYLWVFFAQSDAVERALRDKGILVRPKKDKNGDVGLRITLGTLEQTKRVVDVLSRLDANY